MLLSPPVAGRITRINFKEGDRVKKGDSILNLDTAETELGVKRLKLIWESKDKLEATIERERISKYLFESVRKLLKDTRSVSEEEVKKKELEYLLAAAERRNLETEEKKEQIEYEMALESLEKRFLRSPIDGIIIRIVLQEGESCKPLDPLVHLVDTSKCLFICNIEERIGRSLKKGQQVDLKIQTGDTSTHKEGTIIFTSPIVDSASCLLEVKVEFDNQDRAVRPGVSGVMLLTPPPPSD